MTISPIGFQPYIYNSNALSAGSLGDISPISEDVLSHQIDYSELIPEEANSNPLRRGETKGFMDILAMQMQLGYNRAAQIFNPAESGGTEGLTVEELAENGPDIDETDIQRSGDNLDMELANGASGFRNVSDVTEGVRTTSTVWGSGENDAYAGRNQQDNKGEFNLYRINKAINAYSA